MDRHLSGNTARDIAIACARRIFVRPAPIVDGLIAEYRALPAADFPGAAAVVRRCYQHPVRLGATLAVFALQARHWPMLNLLDSAERERRAFADAMGAAVAAARGETVGAGSRG